MTQKSKEHQKQQTYMTSKAFSGRKNLSPQEPSTFEGDGAEGLNFSRFDEADIKRYKNLFDTFVYQNSQVVINPTKEQKMEASLRISKPFTTTETPTHTQGERQISQLEKDLQQQSIDHRHATVVEKKTAPSIETQIDEDLAYLEKLLNNRVLSHQGSLSELFDEILENEKEPISNYESSVFDANVQMLFEEPPATAPSKSVVNVVPIEPPQMISIDEIASPSSETVETSLKPSPPPVPHETPQNADVRIESVTSLPDFEMPPVPESPISNAIEDKRDAKSIPQPQTIFAPVSSTDEHVSAASFETVAPTFEPSTSTYEPSKDETVPQVYKRKRWKWGIIDTILVLIILIILAIFVLLYGDRLSSIFPFLENMNR